MITAIESSTSRGKVTINDSDGNSVTSNNPDDIFFFLSRPCNGFQVVWDMEEFLKPILKLIPKDIVQKLTQGQRVYFNGTKLFWAVGKGQMFGINYKKHITGNFYQQGVDGNIYQLKTYFPNEVALNLAHVKSMGLELMSSLQAMGINPISLTSPASIISKAMLSKMYLPSIFNMPESALECAEWAANYIREWRATYQIGMWERGQIWDYDLTSAYSSIMASLPNLRYADYIYSEDGTPPEDYYWGILKGEVSIQEEVSPIIHNDGKAYKGTYPDFITTTDWECIKKRGIGSFTPESGWFIRLTKTAYPFDYMMRKFYSFRGNDDLKDRLAKWMANTVWGKFCEIRGNVFGDFYFPIYSCITTSLMRCKMCDFIYDNKLQNDLVSVLVDGCQATKKLNVPQQKVFGEWRINPDSPALVLSSVFQWSGDKRPASVDVDHIINEIKNHPMSKSWDGVALRFLDHDRQFDDLPKNGLDLLNNKYTSNALIQLL